MTKKPHVILIRDGWGYNKRKTENAEVQAHPKYTDYLMETYPNTLIHASGEAVGLPKGYQGNSEVGHMTIGSGRIIFQSMEKINHSIKTKEFFKNKSFIGAINNCKKNKTTLHLIGLLQAEGVHSHIDHLFALFDLCKKEKFENVLIHVITDGRDSPVTKSLEYIKKLNTKLNQLKFGKIATISGRYYAMDRDNRWDRTQKAYNCIVEGQSEIEFNDAQKSIKNSHNKKEFDEFIKPQKLKGYQGIKENDSIIFYNFRTDRTRQLTKAIIEKNFEGFKRIQKKVFFVAMTQFYTPINGNVAFEDTKLNNLLGEVLSNNGLNQLRISETEKYAHVTFFFNGQIETPYKNEDRILINSPKVATYDLKPEMSANEVTERLVQEIEKGNHDVFVVNIVNGDMIGHTGVWNACLSAVTTVDNCVEKIVKKTLEKKGIALIFADHGNIEDQSAKWKTSHTINPVQFILVSDDKKLKNVKLKKDKGLQDVAPTLLKLLNIPKPKEMTGESLF